MQKRAVPNAEAMGTQSHQCVAASQETAYGTAGSGARILAFGMMHLVWGIRTGPVLQISANCTNQTAFEPLLRLFFKCDYEPGVR